MNTDTLDEVITDLPKEICSLLAQAGVADSEGWKSGLNPEALTSPDVDIQRFLVNRCWRQILSSGPLELVIQTRDARSALLDSAVELRDYLRFFKELVIPCVIQLNLLPTQH